MRKIVFQMMTTLNGRVDDPIAWITDIGDDLYADIGRIYDTFDTVLVGHVTYHEMVGHWPAAEHDENGSAANRRMAQRMNAYKKYVFTHAAAAAPPEWNNAEWMTAPDDDAIVAFVARLKAQPGKDITLAGGSRLAQTFVRLGLIDEYRCFVYPVFSRGAAWFDQVDEKRDFALRGTTTYASGVVGLHYVPQAGLSEDAARARPFSDVVS